MISVGVVILGSSLRKSVSVSVRLQSIRAFIEACRHILIPHLTISGEVSGVKNGRALSASHFGKSLLQVARNRSKTLLSTPSGLFSVFRRKGKDGLTSVT